MDKTEIFFAILITSFIQSMAFSVQTEADDDYEMNELIRSTNPQRDDEYQSNAPRALRDSKDQIEKMRSILGALKKSKKPTVKDKNMKQLNLLLQRLGNGKKVSKKQKPKKRNVRAQRSPSKSKDDAQSAALKTKEVDEVQAKESEVSSPELENQALPQDGNETPSEFDNLDLLEEENLSPTKEENVESPKEETPAPPQEEKPAPPQEGIPAPPEKEKKVTPQEEEKKKEESKKPEDYSEAQKSVKEASKRFPQPQTPWIDKFKPKRVDFKLPERRKPVNNAESNSDFFPWGF